MIPPLVVRGRLDPKYLAGACKCPMDVTCERCYACKLKRFVRGCKTILRDAGNYGWETAFDDCKTPDAVLRKMALMERGNTTV